MFLLSLLVFQTLMVVAPDKAYMDALNYLPEGGYSGIWCRISPGILPDDVPLYIRKDIKKRRASLFDEIFDFDGENFRYHLQARMVDYQYVELDSPIYASEEGLGPAMDQLKKKYPNYIFPIWHVTGEKEEVTVVGYQSRTAQECFVFSLIDARKHLAENYKKGSVDRLEEAFNKQHIYTFKARSGGEDSFYLCAMEPDLVIASADLPLLRRMAAASRGEDPGFLSQRDYMAAFEHVPDEVVHISIGFNFEKIAADKDRAELADINERVREQVKKHGIGIPLYGMSLLIAGKQLIQRSVQEYSIEELAKKAYAKVNQRNERNYARKSDLTKQVIKIKQNNTTVTRDGCLIISEMIIDPALIEASDAAREEALKDEAKKKR